MINFTVTLQCREHVSRWRKLSQHNRLHHWGVRRNPKVQLFPELKLQKSSVTAPSDNMPIPIKEQSIQESSGSIDFSKLLHELKISSHGKNIHSGTVHNSILSSAFLVKKLLQFDRSFRPAYYGTWTKRRYAPDTMYDYTYFSISIFLLVLIKKIFRE
jgi:chromatin assembly factor 1 subunit A